MNVLEGDDAGNSITLAAILRGFLLIKTRAPHSIATWVMQETSDYANMYCENDYDVKKIHPAGVLDLARTILYYDTYGRS